METNFAAVPVPLVFIVEITLVGNAAVTPSAEQLIWSYRLYSKTFDCTFDASSRVTLVPLFGMF